MTWFLNPLFHRTTLRTCECLRYAWCILRYTDDTQEKIPSSETKLKKQYLYRVSSIKISRFKFNYVLLTSENKYIRRYVYFVGSFYHWIFVRNYLPRIKMRSTNGILHNVTFI